MNILSKTDIADIDQAGRHILFNVGVHLADGNLQERLVARGAARKRDNGHILLDKAWFDDYLSRAPTQFTLYGREESKNLEIGSGRTYYGNGGRVFQILDMPTGGFRPTFLRDVAHTAALVNVMDYIRFYVIACQASDVISDYYHLNDFYQAFLHTSKHVMGGVDNLKSMVQLFDLASFIAGGSHALEERPFVSVITNSISPLTLDSETTKILDFCATHGIPVTCAPAPISGATAPASLSGTLAQLHAEALFGVVLVQFFQPGAPVMYGAVASTMDLRRMDLAMGSVEAAMINAGAVAMAHHYDLPIYASAGLTDSKIPDVQAGFEKGVSNLLLGLAGADYIHLAAGMIDSGNSIAYEQYVIDNEIIGMIERILRGIRVSPDTIGLECIEGVGPGGNYVLEDHTIQHMFDEFFYPKLAVRGQYDRWTDLGEPTPLTRARAVVEACLDNTETCLDPELIIRIRHRFPEIRDIESKRTIHGQAS